MAASKRGFAAMSPEKQKEIASKGGKAAHAKGTAHEFTPDEARNAGRKGGQAVSSNREHMAKIGRAGGEAVSKDREHMSRIGREGGEARGTRARQSRTSMSPEEPGRESRQ
jgi:general stress protein YciG